MLRQYHIFLHLLSPFWPLELPLNLLQFLTALQEKYNDKFEMKNCLTISHYIDIKNFKHLAWIHNSILWVYIQRQISIQWNQNINFWRKIYWHVQLIYKYNETKSNKLFRVEGEIVSCSWFFNQQENMQTVSQYYNSIGLEWYCIWNFTLMIMQFVVSNL